MGMFPAFFLKEDPLKRIALEIRKMKLLSIRAGPLKGMRRGKGHKHKNLRKSVIKMFRTPPQPSPRQLSLNLKVGTKRQERDRQGLLTKRTDMFSFLGETNSMIP